MSGFLFVSPSSHVVAVELAGMMGSGVRGVQSVGSMPCTSLAQCALDSVGEFGHEVYTW